MSQNSLKQLTELGQSVWLDFIERGFISSGELATLITEDGISGVTSNPAIFQKAMERATYDDAIAAMAHADLAAHQISEALIIEDIRAAADVLFDVFQRTDGREGFVSLEVSPHLAHDTEATYRDAKRLWALVNRENVMIKVPGTQAGISAIRRLIVDGINVNVTLLFSVERYAAVANAFAAGLEDRVIRNLAVNRVASVASFFLSRIDTLVDAKLDNIDLPEASALRGECATACAQAAYRHYQSTTISSRWLELLTRGARPQRLLWASTSTKDPAFSDVKYVEALIEPETVTTLPLETLNAYRDHGRPTLHLQNRNKAKLSMEDIIRGLEAMNIDWPLITAQLEADGIKKFVEPYDAMLAALQKRIAKLKPN